jgi:adenylylsulfate kinase
MKILIMGLPGSGKTFLAKALIKKIESKGYIVDWLNADEVRQRFNDWDFSTEGRIRQAERMAHMAESSSREYVIADFVAPLVEMRTKFDADCTIWVDTIKSGRFEDTNKAFIPPTDYNFRVTEQNADYWAEFIGKWIL